MLGLGSSLNSIASKISNINLFSNPIIMALLITIILVIIALLVYDAKRGWVSNGFKILVYSFLTTLILIFVH